MDKIVLYCKSYHLDVHRAKNLLKSINKHNVDNIPFYISVPEADMDLFKKELGESNYILLKDEDIDTLNHGWKGQQIVKSQFWKLIPCENYLCVDSDCFFIRDFTVSDFLFDDETPYTVCHEYKSFFEFMAKYPLHFDPHASFVAERKHIMELFGREGVIYDFGPGPTIWSSKVWKSLEDNYLIPNNLKFSDLIQANGSEFTWYGEWLLYSQAIRLMPRGPMFKNYHYAHQIDYDKATNYDRNEIAKLYLGIGMPSLYDYSYE
jgi:hypothetical protein